MNTQPEKQKSALPTLRWAHLSAYPRGKNWTAVLTAVSGLAVGLLTLLGQGLLPGNWNTLVNSGAIWLLAAFLIGSRRSSDKGSAAAGLGILAGAVLTYYLAAQLLFGLEVSLGGIGFWGGIALVGGPLFGVAGHWWHSERLPRRVLALALLGGVFTAEGANDLLNIPEKTVSGWVLIAVGLLVPIILGHSVKDRLFALLALPLVMLLGLGVYLLINSHVF